MLKNNLLLALSALLTACSLPTVENRLPSTALTTQEGATTTLGQAFSPLSEQHAGLSGVLDLGHALDAFAARILLITAAERTVDAQYYIWRDDITGNLLLQALQDAARRGVRIRLLLDDNGTSGLDDKLLSLNAEPNIEVRLFNPFPFRTFKPLGFLFDFKRLNRRMHNKSLTVDGQVTVVGGRNIGDEYFGATQDVAFADLDIMATGAIVDEVSVDFDKYWHSDSSYPIDLLVTKSVASPSNDLPFDTSKQDEQNKIRTYKKAVEHSPFIEKLLARELELEWVPVHLVSDDPAKVRDKAPPETLLTARLAKILGAPRQSVDLISPYFVPTQQGVAAFSALAKQGVKVRILTNSLEATDVTAVHAGYAPYRRPLLESGIALFEIQRHSEPNAVKEKAGFLGSSGTSLHAKTFAIDEKQIFVGSFNFDPRSAQLNTELGFVIESENLAKKISAAFQENIPNQAYRLALDDKQRLIWIENDAAGGQTYTTDPNTSWWTRLYVRFLSLLPIESLL